METALIKRGGVAPRPREFYLDAGREYVRRYGPGELVAAAFNPASAKRGGRPDLVDRYYSGREDQGLAWPSLNSIKAAFGGFVAFREALGLPPNPTGGRSRRNPGEAEPIFGVRERRVVVPSEQTAWVRKQLAAAERRALRAEQLLEEAKAQVDEVPAEHERLVKALRDRLADEKSRHKDARRELHNAVRREDRARARVEIVERRDPSSLREVDRLTDLLAKSLARVSELEAGPRAKTVVQKSEPVVRTKTITRKVEVLDEKSVRRAERAEARATELREELSALRESRDALADRLGEIRAEAVSQALINQRVRAAEARVQEVEKQMADQAMLLVGERRQLTSEEVRELRTNGPAGHTIFVRAVKNVARAHADGTGEQLRAALREAMSAAQNWSDRT